MKKALIIAAIAALGFALVGCGGTAYDYYLMEQSGDIRVNRSNDPSYDYRVFIENGHGPGWDGGDREDRVGAVQFLLKDTCPNIQIIEETPIHLGKWRRDSNLDFIIYEMKVKCLK